MLAYSQGVFHTSATAPGTGRLVVTATAGRSAVVSAFASSPLKLLTPANHGRAAWVYTSTYGGGLVDGDALNMNVEVGAGAALFLSTQASTKVYPSPAGVTTDLTARVGGDGLLVVAPDPTVCFAGARYRQTQRVSIDHEGALVLVDWLTAGRRAYGERWQFDRYEARLAIDVGGCQVVYDSLRLTGDDGDLAARIGRFDVLATVALLGPRVALHAARINASVRDAPMVRRSACLVSAAAVGDGCLLRIAGMSSEMVARTIRDLLAFVPLLLGDDPWSRKW